MVAAMAINWCPLFGHSPFHIETMALAITTTTAICNPLTQPAPCRFPFVVAASPRANNTRTMADGRVNPRKAAMAPGIPARFQPSARRESA